MPNQRIAYKQILTQISHGFATSLRNTVVLSLTFALTTFNGPSAIAQSSEICGSVTTSAEPINLTTEGTLDWAHWGDTSTDFEPNIGVYVHKAQTKSLIGDISQRERIRGFKYNDDPRTFTWSNGQPGIFTTSSNQNGVYITAPDAQTGFSFQTEADTTLRTLIVYVGGWKSSGMLRATLSDGASYVDTSLGNSADAYDGVYILNFQASSPSQTLTVEWTQSSDFGVGNVTLQAAALYTTPSTQLTGWIKSR